MDAPLSGVSLTGGMLGLPFRRERRFEASFMVMVPSKVREPVRTAGRMFGNRLREQHRRMSRFERPANPLRVGNNGLSWMRQKEASQAIPPAYSEHIGYYAMMALGRDPDAMKREQREELK